MGRRGWMFVSFMVAMMSARVAGAQPAAPAPDVRGGAPVQDLAPAPADPLAGGLLAVDPGAGDPATAPRGDDGQRMGRRPSMRGGPGMGRGQGMGERPADLARELKLSGEQREKLADIRERQLRRSIQARADLALARLDLRKLLHAETPSLAAVGAQIDKIARIRAELAKSRVASALEMRNVLTVEQRKLLRERRGAWAAGGWSAAGSAGTARTGG